MYAVVFHIASRSRCGRISQGELRRSNLVEVFNTVDEEEDINKVTKVERCRILFVSDYLLVR